MGKDKKKAMPGKDERPTGKIQFSPLDEPVFMYMMENAPEARMSLLKAILAHEPPMLDGSKRTDLTNDELFARVKALVALMKAAEGEKD